MTHCGFQDEAMQALSAKDVPEIHNILEVPYTRQRPLALAFTSAVQFRYPSVIFCHSFYLFSLYFFKSSLFLLLAPSLVNTTICRAKGNVNRCVNRRCQFFNCFSLRDVSSKATVFCSSNWGMRTAVKQSVGNYLSCYSKAVNPFPSFRSKYISLHKELMLNKS